MIQTETQPEPIVNERNLEPETEVSLLDILVVLLERKRFIVRFVLGAAALAIVVSLLLPVRYEAKIVLLPPTQNSSIGSSLLGQLGNMGALGSLASLAGGGLSLKNPADMYVSLLTSRTVEDAMIQRFGLMQEYHRKRMSETRKEFERRTTAVAGTKDGLIRLTVEDGDPKRAAELANGYVEEFRKLSGSLAITEAARVSPRPKML
jgi:tyrosine-protein kinase Etk/Wzc